MPKSVEKFENGSFGKVVKGIRCSECGTSLFDVVVEVVLVGPSHSARVRGMDTFPPLSNDTVQVTVSDRINLTVSVSFRIVASSPCCFDGRKEDDRDSPRDGVRVGDPGGGSSGSELLESDCNPPLADLVR